MLEYAWLIPVFPFVAFLLIALMPKRTLWWEDGAVYAIGGALGAMALSFLVIWEVLSGSTLTDGSQRMEWLVVWGARGFHPSDNIFRRYLKTPLLLSTKPRQRRRKEGKQAIS